MPIVDCKSFFINFSLKKWTISALAGADKCENSLTTHASKILTKVIQKSVKQKVEENLRVLGKRYFYLD